MPDTELPLVSINIPTYNSVRTIEKCLQSVSVQTYPNIETVIVDGKSTDGTIAISEKYNGRIFYARAMCKARKVGIEESRGKYIFLLDSDQYIPPEIIARCVQECEKGEYNILTLFEESIMENNTFIERVIAYDKWLFHSLQDDDVIYGSAIPRFFATSLLKGIELPNELFGFEHNFIYHEALKRGGKVKFLPDLFIQHHEQNTFGKYFRRFYHYGHSVIPAARLDSKLVMVHSLPRRAYFTRKAMSRPLLYCGLLGLYSLKATAAGLGACGYLLSGMRYAREAKGE